MVLGFGVYPKPITDMTHTTTAHFLQHMATSKVPVATGF
jgi:NADH-quinone oxidoreductase subunit M